MPRIARIVVEEYPHHITQRGNYCQKVFSEDEDYTTYLNWIKEYSKKFNFDILAYCLMPNHVHFIAIPKKKNSLAKAFNSSHMRYSQYYNRKNNLTGHLWQGRFYSCVLDEKHLLQAVRYIETNPVRAKLVQKAEDWPWSSAKCHITDKEDILPLKDIKDIIEIDNWPSYLTQKEEDTIIQKIRLNTLTGRPLGSDSFISKLEKLFGKRLHALPRGRPKKGK